MSPRRFGLLVSLLALAVAGASFAVALAVLDDGSADPPPGDGSSDGTLGSDPEGSTTSSTVAVATGALPSPTWIVVLRSEADEATARSVAEQAAADGHAAGVLHSDDYPSLNPGYWVAYAGPHADRGAALAGASAVEADGWTGAYVRCAGSRSDCGGSDGDDEGDGNGNGNGNGGGNGGGDDGD